MNGDKIKEKVLEKIKSGQVKMKPKIYFWLRPLLFILILLLIFVFAIYFLSLLFFIFKINNGWTLIAFGLRGILVLILSLPWGIIAFVLLLMVILETLIIHFSPLYRKPVLYSFLLLLILIFVISFCVTVTSFHARMLLSSRGHNIPLIAPLYQGYEKMDFKNIYCVRILSIDNHEVTVECLDEPTIPHPVKIVLPENFAKYEEIQVGRTVIIFGKEENGIINLFDLTGKNIEEFCEHRRIIFPRMK